MLKLLFPLNKRLAFTSFNFFSSNPGKNVEEPTILSNDPTKEELKLDPIATSLSEYKKAMENFHNEKFEASEELFKRTLTILENSKQNNSDTSIHILKKFFSL